MMILLVFSGLVCTIQAQPQRRIGYLWDRTARTYKRADLPAATEAKPADGEKTVTALKMIWVMPTPSMPGHWRRPRVGEVEARAKLDATHLYPVSFEYPSYPQTSPGSRKIDLRNINEEVKLLSNPEYSSGGLNGQTGRMNVYYVNKIELGMIALTREQDHVIVVDSLYVPSARKLSNSLVAIDQHGHPFLKLIAGTIVYESPINLSLMTDQSGDFIFSADKIYFKSIYEGLQPYEIKPAPPLLMVEQGLQNNIYQTYNGETERLLLNRLYIKLMEQCFNNLAATEDEWARDKLMERFQGYRFRKLKPEIMGNDLPYQGMMNSVVARFDESFQNAQLKKLRDFDGTRIIADGDISQIQMRPLKYYALPTVALLKPLIRDSALGSILYTGTGDAELKIVLETALTYNAQAFEAVANKLSGKGITLEKKLSQQALSIEEQPLKINGKTLGRIVPVSNEILRLELNLPEGAKTIAEIFPKVGNTSFTIDFKVLPNQPPISQTLTLQVDSASLARLDYTEPLKSFQVVERTELTDNLKISSNVSASRPNEGALNYLEVLLDVKFPDRSSLYGPYRLSAYNTISSEIIVPFLKYSNDYTVTVSGRAIYDDGEIDIKPFETHTGIIVLDDAMLSPQ